MPTRCACRRGTPVDKLSGGERRRVALCRLLLSEARTCCCWTSRPTTWTPSPWPGWSVPGEVPGHRRRGHPRPLFPGQRGRLDPGAGPRPGHSLRRATTPPGWSRRSKRLEPMEEKQESARQRVLIPAELEWMRASRPAPARQSPRPVLNGLQRTLLAEGIQGTGAGGRARSYIPPGPRLGDLVIEVRAPEARASAIGMLVEDLDLQGAARRHRRRSLVPNGAGKTTLFRMIVGQERAGRR